MLTAVLGQHVSLALLATASALPMVKSGKLKAIATTGRERAEFLPEVPTLQELGANVVLRSYNFIAAPPLACHNTFRNRSQKTSEKHWSHRKCKGCLNPAG